MKLTVFFCNDFRLSCNLVEFALDALSEKTLDNLGVRTFHDVPGQPSLPLGVL
ncbi:MAG: hypothetical protein OXC19_16965 [Bryobacterales bacterium]|nr:hypothetical protein [Bryobacterales bacterium]